MVVELLKQIYDYSIADKILDERAIKKIVESIIDFKQLHNYIHIVECRNKTEEELKLPIPDGGIDMALYHFDTKELIVFSENRIKLLETLKAYECLFTEFERKFFKNIIILQVILHEIEHATQEKIMRKESSLEAQILKLSNVYNAGAHLYFLDGCGTIDDLRENPNETFIKMIPYIKQVEKIYIENYDYSPSERIAEIKSYQEIIDMLNLVQKQVPNLLEYEKSCQLESVIRGYVKNNQKINSPTIHYLRELKYSQELKDFPWYDEDYSTCLNRAIEQYSSSMRMILGLPITKEEKENVCSVLVKTNRYSIDSSY